MSPLTGCLEKQGVEGGMWICVRVTFALLHAWMIYFEMSQ